MTPRLTNLTLVTYGDDARATSVEQQSTKALCSNLEPESACLRVKFYLGLNIHPS